MKHRVFPFILALSVALISTVAAVAGEEEPSELVQARKLYEKDVEVATRPIRDRYLLRLDSLKRLLGSRGDARAALAVQEEVEKISQLSAESGTKGKFEGRWTVHYDNGSVRKLSVDANDTVTLLEENGKPVAKMRGKIVTKAGEFLLDYGDGKLERWNVSNGSLNIEHFAPKAGYPKSPPAARAVGARTTVK